MDWSKFTTGQRIGLGGGVLAIISFFTPWFGISGLGGGGNAFDVGFLAWFGTLLVFAGAVLVVLKALGRSEVSAGNLRSEQIALLLTGLGTILILIKLIFGHSILGVSLDRKYGIFLAAVAGIATTYGAFLAMQDAGLGMPSADDFKSIAGGDDDGGDNG